MKLAGLQVRRRAVLIGLAALPCCTALPAGGARPEGFFLGIHGSRQWLLMAGEGPVLLVLHGGPGGSETLLFRHFNRALEQRFREAYWDQRGAGRSCDASNPPRSMAVQQFLEDLDAVLHFLKERFNQPVMLLGHSWGSALAMLYAHARPGAVAGVMGVAQVADQGAQEKASWNWALQQARSRGRQRAVSELQAIGPPPLDVAALATKNHWVDQFGGYLAPGFSKLGVLLSALWRGETTVGEVRQVIAANDFSLKAMWPQVRTLDISTLVPELKVPVAFFLGKKDWQCPSGIAAAYFQKLRAPDKRLVWSFNSAHNPPFEEPALFNAEVLNTAAAWGVLV